MNYNLIERYHGINKQAIELTKEEHSSDLARFIDHFEMRFREYGPLEGWHSLDVFEYLVILSRKLNVKRMEILCPASLIHDIKDLEEEHHLKGAEEARKILSEIDYNPLLIEEIAKLIGHHRFKDEREKDYSIENKMLIDADILSKFSFIGRLRSLHLQDENKKRDWIKKRSIWIDDYIRKVKSWFRFEESKDLFKADEMYLFFELFNQKYKN